MKRKKEERKTMKGEKVRLEEKRKNNVAKILPFCSLPAVFCILSLSLPNERDRPSVPLVVYPASRRYPSCSFW